MGRPRNPNTGMVVARDACVVVIGAVAAEYEQITVPHNKTGQMVTMNSDRVTVEESQGVSYVFKPYQRVPASHPAVKASPSSFMPIDELDDAEREMVVS